MDFISKNCLHYKCNFRSHLKDLYISNLKKISFSFLRVKSQYKLLLFACYLAVLTIGCSKKSSDSKIVLKWSQIQSLSDDLPDGIKIFEAIDEYTPLKAWYISVSLQNSSVKVKVVASDEINGRETVSSFANDLGACVVVNGGYYRMDLNPTRHVGLLKVDGKVLKRATPSVMRDSLRFYISRGAFGLNENGTMDIAWVSSRNDSLFEWKEPFGNEPHNPAPKPDISSAQFWEYSDALGAGPILFAEGLSRVSSDEEVFFDTSIPNVHPRTAIGYTEEGELLLLVIDGRQNESRGVNLNELAQIMKDIGAVEALNLDGGGSSSIYANGRMLNKPAGGTDQREVMSAIAIFCN